MIPLGKRGRILAKVALEKSRVLSGGWQIVRPFLEKKACRLPLFRISPALLLG